MNGGKRNLFLRIAETMTEPSALDIAAIVVMAIAASFALVLAFWLGGFYPDCVHLTYSTCH